MDTFTEAELLELLTAVADQKTYYKRALETATKPHWLVVHKRKLEANEALYKKLQAMLLATETAETL
jgi:hypothetical protein